MNIFYSDIHKRHDFRSSLKDKEKPSPFIEIPTRISSILATLKGKPWCCLSDPDDFGLEPILSIHSVDYLDYLENAYHNWKEPISDGGIAYIPYKPGFDHKDKPFNNIPDQDGFFMTDMNVPVNGSTFEAAIAAVNCALSSANSLLTGERVSFGLCRPPGHHSGSTICGGFCSLNNAAISAHWLSKYGKVAILDVDYHAGNGTESIFYERNDVLTISLHANPAWEYPRYAGYAHEEGSGKGKGFHRNYPLPPLTDIVLYSHFLDQALELIDAFEPMFLIVSAGFDTYEDDPLGNFSITRKGFQKIGKQIASLNIPTGILLEGGYHIEALGRNVASFLEPFII